MMYPPSLCVCIVHTPLPPPIISDEPQGPPPKPRPSSTANLQRPVPSRPNNGSTSPTAR